MLDFEISPFETTNTLHLRSKLQEQFSSLTAEEQNSLLVADLEIIKNAKGITEHLSRIYDSKDSHCPISEWWWHIDKIASGELLLKGLEFEYKPKKTEIGSLWNEELIQNSRLQAIRDMIIYNLKHRKFVFNEPGIREKLESISNEKELLEINLISLKGNEFEFMQSLLDVE